MGTYCTISPASFSMLLSFCVFLWLIMMYSMQMLPSKPFLHKIVPHCRMQFRHLKAYTKHGQGSSKTQHIQTSTRPLKLAWTRSMSIIAKQHVLMPIQWQCVRIYFVCTSYLFLTHPLLLVLDPDTKMLHFTKHWGKELSNKIKKNAEELVSACFIIHIHC